MKKAWWLLSLFPILLKRKKQQQQFVKAHFSAQLSCIQSTNQQLYNKLLYYSTWGVVSISEVFAHLHHRDLSQSERFNSSALSLLYALADEMVDHMQLSKAETLAFINGKPSTDFSINWAQELLQHLKDALPAATYLTNAIQAQINSSDQNTEKDINSIRTLTYKKGCATMLLYRLLINSPISDKEQEAVLQLGYNLQLADDIIDAYDDTAETIHTTANTTDLISVAQYFEKQSEISRQLYFDCYGKSGISEKEFLNFELLFGISNLAMKRFTKIGIATFSPSQISKKKRSKFIIDMENPIDAFKALWTTIKS